MKKILSVFLCMMLFILPMGAFGEGLTINATTAELTIAGMDDTYTATFGTDAEGDFVITSSIEGYDIGMQFGTETAYVSVLGMVVAIDYAELASMSDTVGSLTGTDTEAVASVDTDACQELGLKIADDLAPLMDIKSDATSASVAFDSDFAEIWNACGADVIEWAEANTDTVEALAAQAGMTATGDELLETIKNIDPDSEDYAYTLKLDAGYEAGENLPKVYASLNLSRTDGTLADVQISGDETGLIVNVNAADATTNFEIRKEDDATYGAYLNNELLATLSVTFGDAPMDAITDGTDAMKLDDVLSMLGMGA